MQTGAQAIGKPLPEIRGPTAKKYPAVHASGQSTSSATPPKTLASFPDGIFRQYLGSPVLVQALGNVQLNIVREESSHNLLSEGDIERAAALYLLHEVNHIIEEGLLPRLKSPIPVDEFECLGQATSGNSRPDIKFVVNKKTVLIVEYKRAHALRESDWTEALIVAGNPARTAQQIINGIPRGVRTALVENAPVISQQASKYSRDCGLVVLCDYHSMIVLDFTPGNKVFDDLTNPVQYFFSSGESLTHKELLLAAFVYGMRKAGLMKANE